MGARRLPLVPDADVIRALAGLLSETGLTEIEYAIGDHRIRVARESAGKAPVYADGHAGVPPLAPAPSAAAAIAEPDPTALPGTVESPMVGVAYLSPQPGAAPFVRVGDRIEEGDTLVIIEAMKVMNQIRAPRAGRVARIFIEDAEPVEYGAPLLLIE